MRILLAFLALSIYFEAAGMAQGQDSAKASEDSSSISIKENIKFAESNYPNPFWASTVVSFTIERDDSVKVEIFDILGNSRGIILNSLLKSGEHRITSDFKDLPSGIYILKFSNSDTSITKKITLLK